MKIGRRGFFKLAGGLVAAAVAAPIATQATSAGVFIPAERLDMGVPRALKPATPTLLEYRNAVADKIASYDAALAMYRENLISPEEWRSAAMDVDFDLHSYANGRVYLPVEPGMPSFHDHVDYTYEDEIKHTGDVYLYQRADGQQWHYEIEDRDGLQIVDDRLDDILDRVEAGLTAEDYRKAWRMLDQSYDVNIARPHHLT